MEITTLTKQELNAISAYLIHDKRDKSVTFNHKQMADLGLKLFNEVNNVRWDEPKDEPQALPMLGVSLSVCPRCNSKEDIRCKPVTYDCMECGHTWQTGS